VCGAKIMTLFGMFGKSPSILQPRIFVNINLEIIFMFYLPYAFINKRKTALVKYI
jgi:hypothetical protein